MHIFPRDRYVVNGILTPGPLLRDLGAVVGEFNGGLDSENIEPLELTAASLELEAWHAFEPVELAGPVVMTGSYHSGWTDIPGAQFTATTIDGVLHVMALLRWEDTSAVLNVYLRQLRILVDWGPVSQSPQVGVDYYLRGGPYAFKGFLHAFGTAPVGPGDHDVRAQIRILTNQNAVITTSLTNIRVLSREAKR